MIVITGAAGFIGSSLAWHLNQKGITDLLLVDQLGTSEKWKNLVSLAYTDYQEKNDFLEYLKSNPKIEAIFHLGACSATTERDASYLVNNNFLYTKKLAQWAVQNNCAFIYASSAATYGEGEFGYQDDKQNIQKLRPLNMYGYSKQMFDLWAEHNGYADKLIGLKYFNVYGCNEYHKGDMRSVVHKAFEQIMEKGKVQLFKSHREDYGDGEQLRDFIYVKDAVEMTWACYEQKLAGGLYNIGTGKARSWVDLVTAVFSALNKPPEIEFIPMPKHLREKYQYYTQAEMAKFQATGTKAATFSLEEGVADTIKYLSNDLQRLG